MASVVSAAVTKYGTLAMTGVTRPVLFFDGIPQTGASGAQLDIAAGWVNLVDDGTDVGQSEESGCDFEYNPIELTKLRFEVFGPTLVFVDAVMVGIKYSTGAATGQLGFDFGTLTIAGQSLMECRRTREQRSRSSDPGPSGGNVWQGTIWYDVQAKVN